MKRLLKPALLVLLLLVPVAVFAQDGEPPPPDVDWTLIVQLLINVPLVTLVMQVAKRYIPTWPPLLKTLVTLAWGPVMMTLQTLIGGWIGAPVDFSNLIGLFSVGAASGVMAAVPFSVGKREAQRAVALIAAVMLGAALSAAPVSAQTFEVGAGALVNEDEAIDVSDARAFVSVTGIEIPLPGETYTGGVVELGYSTAALWSIWSTNRTEIARVIAGVDVRIARGGPMMGSDFDIDMRAVAGYRLTEHLGIYAYMFESGTPFQFLVGWKF